MTNAMISILEEFRTVAKAWIEDKRAADFSQAIAALTPRSGDPLASAEDDLPF